MELPFFSPGSWPNDNTRHMMDTQLLALEPDQIKALMETNMRQILNATKGKVAAIGHGEPGIWQDWMRIPAGTLLRPILGLPAHDGRQYYKYFDKFGFRNGNKINPDLVPSIALAMGYAEWAIWGYEIFARLREEYKLPKLKYQIGIPHPFDLGMLTGLYLGGDAFTKATARQMEKILRAIPTAASDVVFTIEMPISQVFVAMASMVGLGTVMGKHTARGIQQLIDAIDPSYQNFVTLNLHPCWGDLGNRAVMEVMLESYAPFVPQFLRQALCRRLQSVTNIVRLVRPILQAHGDKIHIVQLPLAAGTELAPLKPRAYKRLERLMGFGVGFSAGITHEGAALENIVRTLACLREQLGDTFISYIGPRCGLGRCTEQAASYEVRQALSADTIR